MALSDVKIRHAKPKDKPYKLTDGEGMYLLVHPNGSKYWRFKYRFLGREKVLAFGVYPDVSIVEARRMLAKAQDILADGNDPTEIKRETRHQALQAMDNSFAMVAREWYGKREHAWVPSYAKRMLARLEHHVFPKLGHKPISEISAPDILTMLRVIENNGALETVRIVKQMCGQIFMYAMATGRATGNPVPDLRGAFKTHVVKHHAYLSASELPGFLKATEAYHGHPVTRLAVKLLLLTFVRTVELRAAKWSEFDLKNNEWRIPAKRMKMREPHIVPLARQTVALLQELQKHTGHWEYLLPKPNKPIEPMSENGVISAIYRLGYKGRVTGHGFRATASTILNENGFTPDVIERQLAHGERNHVRAAYNHAQYLPERRKMMQWWADYLDKAARKGAESKN